MTESDRTNCWYVFYCRSRAEKKADQVLKEKKYESYLPLVTEIHQWSDRKKKVQVPLFKGYVFVNCKFHDLFYITEVNHIVAPVKIGEEFAVLRERDIELLRKIEKYNIEATAEPIEVQKGDKVKIIMGTLKGYEGICIQDKNKNYVLIAIEGISQYIRVTVHKGFISKTPDKK